MSAATQFHALIVARVDAEAGGAIAVTFAVPENLRTVFAFTPGQFLTLRATIDGQDVRRSYSICSSLHQWRAEGAVQVGIRPWKVAFSLIGQCSICMQVTLCK